MWIKIITHWKYFNVSLWDAPGFDSNRQCASWSYWSLWSPHPLAWLQSRAGFHDLFGHNKILTQFKAAICRGCIWSLSGLFCPFPVAVFISLFHPKTKRFNLKLKNSRLFLHSIEGLYEFTCILDYCPSMKSSVGTMLMRYIYLQEFFHFPPISLLLRFFILPFLESQDLHFLLNVTPNCPSVCVRCEILRRGSPAAQIMWS